MLPPSTALRPAGTPSLAEWASTFQCAVPRTCQMPFRSGLRSGVRGPLYAEAVWAAEARDGPAPRGACATPAAMAIGTKARAVALPMVAIGFFILTGESVPYVKRPSHARLSAVVQQAQRGRIGRRQAGGQDGAHIVHRVNASTIRAEVPRSIVRTPEAVHDRAEIVGVFQPECVPELVQCGQIDNDALKQ